MAFIICIKCKVKTILQNEKLHRKFAQPFFENNEMD